MHRLARRPPLRPPKIGDIVRLSGPGGMGRQYEKVHGVGIITSVHKPEHASKLYEVKRLKSEERMRFHEEDLIIVSDVDR